MSLPFTDAAFDAVTCEQALAFFSDPGRAGARCGACSTAVAAPR